MMGNFLNRMRDALEHYQRLGRTAEADAIEAVLKYRLEAASAAYWSTLDLENVEQLFSLASAARDPVSQFLPTAMAATLEFSRSCGPDGSVQVNLNDSGTMDRLKPDASKPVRIFTEEAPQIFRAIENADREGRTTLHVGSLLGMLNADSAVTGTNTFISFNYDTLVEDALTRLEVPWTYGFEWNKVSFKPSAKDFWGSSKEEKAIPILKLHGSVNWGHIIDAKRGDKLSVFRSYESLVTARALPRLIPPTWSKNVEDQVSGIWEKAINRLHTATRIIIIGFSMPETDLHFRYLLAAGLQGNAWLRSILFVNPDAQEVEKRARLTLRASYIDQNLIRFISSKSDIFANALVQNGGFISPDQHFDIGRKPQDGLSCWVSARLRN